MQNKRRIAPRPSSPEDPSKCVKFSLFFLNVIFWLAAVLILGVGVYMMVEKRDAYQSLSDFSFDPALLFVSLGGFLFIITFMGCIGALRENTCLLCCYASIISLLLVIEITCGVLGFVFREALENRIKEKLQSAIKEYRDDPDLQLVIDTTQTEFECCGVETYTDWQLNVYFNCSAIGAEACGVPKTCCKSSEEEINSQCGFEVGNMEAHEAEKKIHIQGCLTTAVNWFKNNLIAIAITSFGILLLQIISLWLATSLRGQVQDIKDTFVNPRHNRR